jgi:hypothetical protein
MAGMRGLGRLFDVGVDFVPVDLNTAGATGKRLSLQGATGVTFIFALGATGGTEDIVLTFKQQPGSGGVLRLGGPARGRLHARVSRLR